ncbi:MAG: Ca2+-dependent phosphoinositide-specific phospholipase C, partial [Polyangiales bacterium]
MRRVIPLLLLLSCSGTKESPADSGVPDANVLPELPKQPSPRLDEVFTLATHNSYWVDRGAKNDSFASGTSERLLDQLLYDHVRAIEIDIHKDGFKVYHTVPGNSVCDDLRSCLGQVHAFQAALPNHDPLLIVLELKELFEPNFDETHTPESLDAVLLDELSPHLFSPSDLMSLCPGSTTLGDCARRVRWPSLMQLRGRVMVALIGNWDELGSAQSTKDWAVYAAKAPTRAAFPMASPWKLDASTFTPRMQEIVSQDELDLGWQQSAFVQIEDLTDPHAAEGLARGAIVRADGANSVADQDQRIAKGFQFLQTDTPSIRTHDRGIAFPYGPMTPGEPGSRFLMGPTTELAFAYAESDMAQTWSTWVTSGNDARRIGCVRASASLTDEALASMTVCRVKTAGEHVVARVEVCKAGTCTTKDATEADGAGEQVGLQIRTASCAAPRVAASARGPSAVDWRLLDEVCFDQPLHYRG